MMRSYCGISDEDLDCLDLLLYWRMRTFTIDFGSPG